MFDSRHVPKPDRCSVECVFFWRVTAEYLVKLQATVEKENDPTNTPNRSFEEDNEISPTQVASLLERILPCVTDYVDFIIQ